jgi:hypothetical protein
MFLLFSSCHRPPLFLRKLRFARKYLSLTLNLHKVRKGGYLRLNEPLATIRSAYKDAEELVLHKYISGTLASFLKTCRVKYAAKHRLVWNWAAPKSRPNVPLAIRSSAPWNSSNFFVPAQLVPFRKFIQRSIRPPALVTSVQRQWIARS